MLNPDESIDRVLAGFRDCSVPEGMERRILAAARDRVRHGTSPATFRQRWAFGIAAASLAMVCLLLIFMNSRHSTVTQSKLRVPVDPHSATRGRGNSETASVAPRTSLAPEPASVYTRQAQLVRVRHRASPSDLRAASHPAPEAPLTLEEKLLLRVVRTGNPHGLAMLDPELRARTFAEEGAEFEKFVEEATGITKGESE